MADATTGHDNVTFNPFEPGFFDDPYVQYAQLRETEPIHRSPFGAWMLFRHDDTFEWLRRPDTSVVDESSELTDRRRALADAGAEDQLLQGRSLLFLDPPDHTRLRRLVSRAFTPRTVETLRPRVEELVAELLDEMAAQGEVDLISQFAFPLPFTVISEMLGMPVENRDQLRAWSTAGGRALEPVIDDETARQIVDALGNLQRYVREVVQHKRRHPGDDLLSALISAEDAGDVLSDDELVAQVVLLYVAGHETTVNLIGNGTLALLRHRDQMERWRHDPSLDVSAVDELLRYDSPVQFTRRIATTDLEIAGQQIAESEFVLTCLGACNRDPRQWGDTADRLDVSRPGASHHMSFGSGIHFCLGAALARMEGQVAIGGLIRRFPDMELRAEPHFRPQIVLRGLQDLPLSLS